MTGEMNAISQDGTDTNGECWPVHAAIAADLGGRLEPFDSYQGPYIVIGADVRTGGPYSAPIQGMGITRLWLFSQDGIEGTVYREDTGGTLDYFPINDETEAIAAARALMENRPD